MRVTDRANSADATARKAARTLARGARETRPKRQCRLLNTFAQVGVVAGDREDVGDLARWAGLAELPEGKRVLHRPLLAHVAAGASGRQELIEEVGDGLLDCFPQAGRRGSGLVARLLAGQPQGNG